MKKSMLWNVAILAGVGVAAYYAYTNRETIASALKGLVGGQAAASPGTTSGNALDQLIAILKGSKTATAADLTSLLGQLTPAQLSQLETALGVSPSQLQDIVDKAKSSIPTGSGSGLDIASLLGSLTTGAGALSSGAVKSPTSAAAATGIGSITALLDPNLAKLAAAPAWLQQQAFFEALVPITIGTSPQVAKAVSDANKTLNSWWHSVFGGQAADTSKGPVTAYSPGGKPNA